MNQARISILVLAALIAAPSLAQAQKKKKPAPKPVPTAPAEPAPAAPAEIDADAPPGAAAAPAAGAEAAAEPAAPEGGDIEAICKIDPSACPTVNLADAAKRDMHEKMYAVQQIYALRYHRFEIQPVLELHA